MKLSIQAKPNSKKTGIEKISETEWTVKVRESALEGQANDAIIKAVAEELKIPKTRIIILRGQKSKHKLLEIL